MYRAVAFVFSLSFRYETLKNVCIIKLIEYVGVCVLRLLGCKLL